jgi:hypothetical protein
MKRIGFLLLAAGLLVLFTGCAGLPALQSLSLPSGPPAQILTATRVDLSQRNYRILKPNVIGFSEGFKLFGLIGLKSATHAKAMSQLYWRAEVVPGSAQTIANVVDERTSTYYILFSIPKVTIRADLIEFTAPEKAGGDNLSNSTGTQSHDR